MNTLAGLLTPLIAALALYIAYQQWRTNDRKLRLDLFDRRMAVYEAANALLFHVMQEGSIDDTKIREFSVKTHNAVFLFDPEVVSYLESVRTKAFVLATTRAAYRDRTQEHPEGYDHQAVVRKMHEAMMWLIDQPQPMQALFRKHMNLVS